MYYDILCRYKESAYFDLACREFGDFIESVPTQIFSFSLTINSDLLSQWRGYGRDDGVVIGFSDRLLKDISVSNGIVFQPVVYRGEFQARIMSSLVDLYMNVFSETDELHRNVLMDKLMRSFVSIAPFVKNGSFEEEAECRLCSVLWPYDPYNHIENMISRNGRRFIPLKLSPRLHFTSYLFREIVIGPCENREKNMARVEGILSREGISCQNISASDTPFQPVRK